MSWSPLSWLVGGYTKVEQPAAIESIPKPQGAKYYFGPQAYTEHNLGKILDITIPPDWNRPIGENHLLIYIPGKMEPNPDLPALHCINDTPTYTLKSWYETYEGSTPSWFLVPLNAQPNYDLTPNPELTFPGPVTDMQYSAVWGYGGVLMYLSLEILKLHNTEIKFINIPNSEILRNQIWSLQKISS